jgi:serine protease Do
MRQRFNLKAGADGVLVTSVEGDSQAAERRISAGDRILEINQETVSKPEDVARKLKQLKDQGRRSALLFIASPNDDKRFVPLTLK